jgi:hypothetical protein
MFPSFFKIEGDRRVVSQSGKGTLGCIENIFVGGANVTDLAELVGGEGFEGVHDVEV